MLFQILNDVTLNMLLDAKKLDLNCKILTLQYISSEKEKIQLELSANPETEVTRISNFSSFTYSNKAVVKV